MPGVSLNVDLGELEDEPEELYRLATQVNVACGGHAGDARSVARAVALARAAGATIAAHPSYPDREGFGRRSVDIAPPDLAQSIAAQCALLRAAGVDVVKPHGALYHDAARNPRIAEAVLEGAAQGLGGLRAWVGPRALEPLLRARGVELLHEGFADRGYDASGALLPRGTPGALLERPEEAAAQAVRLARSGAYATLCVHGDTEGALFIARAVREALAREGLLA